MSTFDVVVGRVEEGGVAVATLEIGAQRFARAEGDAVVMRAGGRVVRLRLPAEIIVGEVIDGPWGGLARPRLTALFADVAPGDHVQVRISGVAVGVGDVLAVRVERRGKAVTAVRAARGADEDSAAAALAHAEAEATARAADEQRATAVAEERAQRRRVTPHPPGARTTVVLGALAAGMAAITVVVASGWNGAVPQGAAGASMWSLAAGLGGAAMLAWSARHDVPLVHHVGVQRPTWSRQVVLFLQVVVALLAMAIAAGRNKASPDRPVPEVGLIIACILPAVVALIDAVRGFLSVRGLLAVHRAPRLAVPPPPRTWGVIEGVVTGSGDARLTATTTGRVQTSGSGRGGWVWMQCSTTTTAAPVLRVDAGGWEAEVHTTGMIWAAPPVWLPRDDNGATRARAAIGPGDRVSVLARTGAEGDTELRATGPESLIVVAGEATAYLRRALVAPLTIAAYVALIVVSIRL